MENVTTILTFLESCPTKTAFFMTSKLKDIMNFKFIPYQLNADISDFKTQSEYICSDNGIELYKVKRELIQPILNILVSNINLYFFEGSLITVYIHLTTQKSESIYQIKGILENAIKRPANALETDFGAVYEWKTETEFLGLVEDQKDRKVYLYHSLKKHSVF